jgi:gluconate 2-dehydrogenase gamma chain
MQMEKLSRRSFFKAAGAGAAAIAGKAHALTHEPAHEHVAHEHAAQPDAGAAANAGTTYTFFRPDEARFIEAAVARLIPPDANGPGALEAGVPNYLDKQLGGAWGAGERLYRSGPWQQGVPGQGYQLPFTPAELFHNALRAINEDLQHRRGSTFDRLPGPEQDAYLQSLQTGQQSLNGVPAHTFFESLLGLAIEGFFSDPIYGGNRDMVAWKMIGFPGAYASFYDLVDQHGILYTRPPMSIGENVRGTIMIQPVSPPAHAPSAESTSPPARPSRRKGGK